MFAGRHGWVLAAGVTAGMMVLGGCGEDDGGAVVDADHGGSTSTSFGAPTGMRPEGADTAEAFLKANETMRRVLGEPLVVTIASRPTREVMVEQYRKAGVSEEDIEAAVDDLFAQQWIGFSAHGPRTRGKHVQGTTWLEAGKVTRATMSVIDSEARTGEEWDLVTGERTD